ncbi:MAG: hypothetical protein ACRD3W_09310, partial [Terriglobales bacterium]
MSDAISKRSNACKSNVSEKASGTGLRHLKPLDGLRGLAVIAVFFHHCIGFAPLRASDPFLVRAVAKIISFGSCGVDL